MRLYLGKIPLEEITTTRYVHLRTYRCVRVRSALAHSKCLSTSPTSTHLYLVVLSQMAAGTTFEEDLSLWQEQTRLFNFLKHYDLHQYYPKFVDSGVKRLSHLKDVVADEACLNEIGLTRPERIRLRKKVKENVESFGKFKVS